MLKKFRLPKSQAFTALAAETFTPNDVRNDQPVASYVLAVIRHARDTGVSDTAARLSIAWAQLDGRLRQFIDEPDEITIVEAFIHRLESKKQAWSEVYANRSKPQHFLTDSPPPHGMRDPNTVTAVEAAVIEEDEGLTLTTATEMGSATTILTVPTLIQRPLLTIPSHAKACSRLKLATRAKSS